MEILFISKNEDKRKEIKRIFESCSKELDFDIIIKTVENVDGIESLKELQEKDIEKVLKYKLTEIYKIVKRPILVEHTGLELECLNGYPGSQTQLFWDSLAKKDEINRVEIGKSIYDIADSFSEYGAKATTYLGFCDGKKIITTKGEVCGTICQPKGNSKFQWDVVFKPKNLDKTFAELSEKNEKDKYSMRTIAIKNLINEIKENSKQYDYLKKYNTYKEVAKQIASDIKNEKLMVFVGAGVSRNVGMPSWGGLISKLGEELGYDSDVFFNLGDFLELAEYYTILKNEEFQIYKNNKDSVFSKIKEHLGVSEENLKNRINDSIFCESFYDFLNLGIKKVYTTNYDSLIENTINIWNGKKNVDIKFDSIYNLKTMNDARESNINIIKLHGDLREVENIVLNQSSYFDRYDFESCLDIQLRADMLKKSILFLGYSFSDINIKYMFHKLNKLWDDIDDCKRTESYIFLTENNEVQKKILEKNKMIPIICNELDKREGIIKFLNTIVEELNKL